MTNDLKGIITRSRLKARIIADALGKCNCHEERAEFAELVTAPQDNADLLFEKALIRADDVQNNWINRIRHLAYECKDMAEFKEKLFGLYGEMSTDEMAGIMAQTMLLGNMVGRAEVQEEVK